MAVELGNDWDELLGDEFSKEYYLTLRQFLIGEYRQRTIYPNMYKIFEALKRTSYANTKVVLLGQDPTMAQGRPMAWLFQCQRAWHLRPPCRTSLKSWPGIWASRFPPTAVWRPGRIRVLLLNTTLTVRQGQAGSHQGKGWERFTDRVLELLNQKATPVVFLLWGGQRRVNRG